MFLNSNALDKHKHNDHGLAEIGEDLLDIEHEVSGPLSVSGSASPPSSTTGVDSPAASGSSRAQVFN